MRKPPPPASGGWKKHRDQINELRDFVIKTRPIPVHGHSETPAGTMPPLFPTGDQSFLPMFHPLISNTGRLAMVPGFVMAPYSETSEASYHNQFQHFPIEPKVSGSLMTATPTPTLTLNTGAANFIYMDITWTQHTVAVGKQALLGGGFGWALDSSGITVSDNFSLTPGDQTLSGSASLAFDKVGTPIEMYRYSINPAIPPTFSVQDESERIETATSTHMLCGIIQLGLENEVTSTAWFLQGTAWLQRPSVLLSSSTQGTGGRAEPPAITVPENVDFPQWTE